MTYGDFSSLVQLGIGLHLGTALLQIYGEVGLQPLIRSLTRIEKFIRDFDGCKGEIIEDLRQIESDFQIFRIKLFNEYKKYMGMNAIIAFVLVIILIFISYKFSDPLGSELSVLFVVLSTLPAPITLGVLWFDASKAVKPLKCRADELEDKCSGL